MIVTVTGPRSVGKTTISKILAKKLKLSYISSDEIGEKETKKEGGLDKAIKSGFIKNIIEKKGHSLIEKEYKKDNFIFDLSGGAFGSKSFLRASEKVRKISREKSIVIGLLPYKDKKRAIKFLFEREKNRIHFKEMNKKDLFEKTKKSYVKFPKIFEENCNLIIYTENKTSNKIAKEILNNLRNFYN